MAEVMKGILLDEETIKKIKEMAEKERRSFTRQVQVMLETILKEQEDERKTAQFANGFRLLGIGWDLHLSLCY